MLGLFLSIAVWTPVLIGLRIRDRRLPPSDRMVDRERIALVLALLGTITIAGVTEADEVLRNPVVAERLARGALAGLTLVLVMPLIPDRISRYRPERYLGLTALGIYLIVAGVSALYSVAPLVTAAKTFEMVAGFSVVLAIALSPGGRARLAQTVQFVVILQAALLGLAIAGFFFAPPGLFAQIQPRPGFVSRFTMGAPYGHSNTLAATGGLVAAYALAKWLTRDGREPSWRWLGLMGMGVLGVVLASGRQGVAILTASVVLLLLIHKRSLFVLLLGPAVALIVTTFWSEISRALLRNRPTTLATLSGRTTWWTAGIESWGEHPWTGYGYGAGGRFVALRSIGRGLTSNIHSGYLEALLGVGLLGILPLAVATLRAGFWSVASLFRRSETHLAILLLPLLLRTFVAQGFGGWLNYEFVIFASLVGIADCSARSHLVRSGKQLQTVAVG